MSYTLDRTVPAIAEAVAAGVCRHCLNARAGETPLICQDCARCSGCQCSPNCVTREWIDQKPPAGPSPVPPPSIEID